MQNIRADKLFNVYRDATTVQETAGVEMTDPTKTRLPNHVDVHVGTKIRLRRKMMKMSQTELGKALGVTFQQIQKYERGVTRISASRVWRLCEVLDTNLAYFFDGIDGRGMTPSKLPKTEKIVQAFIMSPAGVEFAKVLPHVPMEQRAALLELVRAMAAKG